VALLQPETSDDVAERLARPAIWAVAAAAVGLLGFRGFQTLRDGSLRGGTAANGGSRAKSSVAGEMPDQQVS
jgi:hypothetical protein